MNEREDGNRFHVLDYVVFSATLAISAGIGIYFRFSGGKQRTNKVVKITVFYINLLDRR